MKNRFKLNELKIKSFITSLEKDSSMTIAGGLRGTGGCAKPTRLEATCDKPIAVTVITKVNF